MNNKFFISKILISGSLIIMFSFCKKGSGADPEDKKEEQKESSGTPEYVIKDYKMVWNDEFNGTTLDLTKWNYRQDGVVRKLGTVNKETISLDGKGNVLITVFRDNKGIYNIGQISTEGLYATRYGYFECRVKLQKSLGPHTAFWLQSPTYGRTAGNPDKDGVEIDIFEYHRSAPTKVYFNTHWDGHGDYHKNYGNNITLPAIVDGYHTFGLEWNENEYTFYVDGKKGWSSNQAISRTDQFIILSAELTGWGGDPALGTFPDAVAFDYVRVYKKK